MPQGVQSVWFQTFSLKEYLGVIGYAVIISVPYTNCTWHFQFDYPSEPATMPVLRNNAHNPLNTCLTNKQMSSNEDAQLRADKCLNILSTTQKVCYYCACSSLRSTSDWKHYQLEGQADHAERCSVPEWAVGQEASFPLLPGLHMDGLPFLLSDYRSEPSHNPRLVYSTVLNYALTH